MVSASINTRADLDAIAGTMQHKSFMDGLAGSLYRLEKDDEAKTWKAVVDTNTIEKFGFTQQDFPNAQPPTLPDYVGAPALT